MFIVDTNVLVYAVNADSPRHRACAQWLDEALTQGAAVGLPWMSILGFLRVTTSRAALPHPMKREAALTAVREWLSVPGTSTPEPTPNHLAIMAGLLDQADKAGNLVNDAHLAALAIQYGGAVVSFDSDFGLFGVEWIRPA